MGMEFLPFPRGKTASCNSSGRVEGSDSFNNNIGQPLLDALRGEKEHCQVLVATEFLNKAIERCLVAKFKVVGLSKKKQQDLIGLGTNAIIGTFGAKMDICLAFGFIDQDEHKALTAIRKIRNEFAHADFAITFSDEKIEPHIQNLDKWRMAIQSKAICELEGGMGMPEWVYELALVGELKPGDKIDSKHIFLGATIMLYRGLANLRWKIRPEEYDGAVVLSTDTPKSGE